MDEKLLAAIERLSHLVTSNDGYGHLTCSEFQPIAEILVFAGFEDAAADAIESHASGDDDESDAHHAMYEGEADDDAAAEFVRQIRDGEPLARFRVVFTDGDTQDAYTEDMLTHLDNLYSRPHVTQVWVDGAWQDR